MLKWPWNKDDFSWPRPMVQAVFIFISLSIGLQFGSFLHILSTESCFDMSLRPPAVDAYLPISSLMSLVFLLKTGHASTVHPAGLVIFTLSLLLSLLFRRGFCSWVCPFGALEEWAYKTGKRMFGRNFGIPDFLDYPLRALKYLVLGFFIWSILRMPTEGLMAFVHGPYNRVADAKMYAFFQDMTIIGIAFLAVMGVLSLLFANFWCRYLCPYGALLGIVSFFSPWAVRRNADKCTGCGKCAAACPNRLHAGNSQVVRSVECTACLECVRACGKQEALQLAAPKSKLKLSYLAYGLILTLSFYATAKIAESLNYWQTDTPVHAYKSLLDRMHEIAHP